jgi:predicted DNA-binding transcriptional regulator AlpA
VKELEPGQKWANDKQTACYCGITIPTLLEWDDNEGFPPAVRIGRKKLRNLDEVDAWLRARTVRRLRSVTEEAIAT